MPDWAPHIRPRLASLHLSPTREHEIIDELSQHLDDRWRELVAGGASEEEATRLALAGFREGNLLAHHLAPLHQARTPPPITPGATTGHGLGDVWQDVRYAARMLRRQPAFTVAAVLTLALGLGATAAVFSIVEGVLVRPLPYPDADRIVRVGATTYSAKDSAASFSDRGYWHFVDNNRSFETFGAYRVTGGAIPLTGDGPPLLVEPGRMTLSAFEALGVFPELGRLPTPQEDAPGGARAALISHDLWITRYGADPSILGRRITLSGMPWEVIGVMPAGYDFPTPEADVWIPLQLNPASQNSGGHNLRAIARLAPGVTIAAATADARRLIARFDEAGYDARWFETIFDGGAVVRPLHDVIVGDVRQPLLIVFGTVGFVLLIVCSNVANLLLVRAEGRRQENGVRMALGSSRVRLVRHLLIESGMLASMGGAAGVLLAYAGVRALIAAAPAGIPRLHEVSVDATAVVFTAFVSALAAALFGVLPALRASALPVVAALRDASRSAAAGRARHRTRNVLVVAQVALAFVLVIGCGLMVRSFQALRAVDPGFSADGVLTFQVQPMRTKYPGAQAMSQLYDLVIERLEAVPGVTRVGAIDALPLTGNDEGFAAVIAEFPPVGDELPPVFTIRRATPGYFDAMDIPLIEGRTFTPDDHNRRLPSVVVSYSVKARYWPESSALGKRIDIGRASARVVGVVGDVHNAGLDVAPEQYIYVPIVDSAGGGVQAMTMTIRTASEPVSLVTAIRGAIAEVDGDLPMAKVQSMERVLDDSMSHTTFTMSLLVVAAAVALVVGCVGIHGVLSYVVSQRTAEIGIRSALGASPVALRRMILGQGMRLTVIGVLIGLVAAVALGRVIVAQLYAVSPADPVTLGTASALFLTVAIVASLLPAARAAGTAPVEALRAR